MKSSKKPEDPRTDPRLTEKMGQNRSQLMMFELVKALGMKKSRKTDSFARRPSEKSGTTPSLIRTKSN